MDDTRGLGATEGRHYRLRGEVDDEERTFDLALGEHRLGSLKSAEIVIAAPGVSREHAILTATSTGLLVEDCGSKNGTFVNGGRVQRAGVPVGAELRFGPVRLVVEALDAAAELAIRFDSAPSSSHLSSFDAQRTTPIAAVESESEPTVWMSTVEGLLERLARPAPESLTRALSFLAEALPAESCAAVVWGEDHEPLALASWGEIHELPPFSELEKLRPAGGRGRRSVFYPTQPPLSAAFNFDPPAPLVGLVVWGDFPKRLSAGSLLRTLVQLVARLGPPSESQDEALPRPALATDLVFPEGYRPGRSEAWIALFRQVRAVSRSRLPVLIHGETGAGKEIVARILHLSSDRADRPFVAVNCAAIAKDLLEAEMFGVVKGAATGVEPREGTFQQAEGGSLFLDEIGELAPPLQAKLLRALQEREIQPVGGRPRKIDVRIFAATNLDLDRDLGERLRHDLYYRLAGCVLEVPPLRRCRDDIPGLVAHYLKHYARETGLRLRGVTARALALLRAHDWPGNVRELEHKMHRLVLRCGDGAIVDVEHLDPALREPREKPEIETTELDSLLLAPRVEALERSLIREALQRTGGHQSEAADLLGLSRNGLANKLKRLDLKDTWATSDRPRG